MTDEKILRHTDRVELVATTRPEGRAYEVRVDGETMRAETGFPAAEHAYLNLAAAHVPVETPLGEAYDGFCDVE